MLRYLSDPAPFIRQNEAYLALRAQEGRLLRDEAVRRLPFTAPIPGLQREWMWRKRSFLRLRRYLLQQYKQSHLRILDLGCGNGWMSNRLAGQAQWDVWAVDVNETELIQGDRLFARDNLQFVFADILADALPADTFDLVVMAAAAQYFPDMARLRTALRRVLKSGGVVHCIDTPFYPDEAAQAAARRRSMQYYTDAGAPDMATFYFHHSRPVGARRMDSLLDRLLQRIGYLGPFPWIVLK